jgi:hypothetical protein
MDWKTEMWMTFIIIYDYMNNKINGFPCAGLIVETLQEFAWTGNQA